MRSKSSWLGLGFMLLLAGSAVAAASVDDARATMQ